MPLRLPSVRPANDDEHRLTQNIHKDFADNGSGAMYHYCWRDSEDDKMFQGNTTIYSRHRLINSIRSLPEQWREMPQSSFEELTFGALSGQLGCRASEPARNTEDVEDLTAPLGLEAVPESR